MSRPATRQRPPLSDEVRITAQSVERAYVVDRKRHLALRGVSLEIGTGRSIGIVGESGSGKSTIAKILSGLDQPSSGRVDYNGLRVQQMVSNRSGRSEFRRHVQLIAQDTSSSFDPTQTLRNGMRAPAMRLRGLSREAADEVLDEVLDQLEVPADLADRKPNEVSGGQRQRCAIARAFVVRPRVLLCDEVVSALDVSVQGAVLNILKEYVTSTGAGLAFVSHSMSATAFLVDEIVVMYQGEIVEHSSTEDLISRPKHPYTRHLLAAAGGLVRAAP